MGVEKTDTDLELSLKNKKFSEPSTRMAVTMHFFSFVSLIIRSRGIAIFIVVKYANVAFIFRRRHREEDHVLHAGDSHKANDGTATKEKCPRHPAQQDPQGRGGWRDEEADKGYKDRCEFRDPTGRGESVRKCRTETDEEPGENDVIQAISYVNT